ncbi:MAG: sigma-54-dependent transcriptional regulator [bacterium]
MKGRGKILVIDDDPELLKSCMKFLAKSGYHVKTLQESGAAAAAEIESGSYDVIICDLSMPGMSGFELLQKAKAAVPDVPFVIFSAYGSIENAVRAMREGAFDFIEKPFRAERLRGVVEKSLRTLHKETRELQNKLHEKWRFHNLIGKSVAMQKVFDRIRQVAVGDANITISGESGTGKELVARSIHGTSPRREGAFVPVNCGAFPENLFESELFGYEKGAFTGAIRQKPGLLEYANDGTFFLDEICELSPALQVKLLRVLQDRQIRRVGGTKLIDVNVRIISASNRKLEVALRDGTLREDLYYRLNVISIHVPPLRQRKEDIPILARHFIDKFSKATSKVIRGISDEALHCLQNYGWPGNVRELENVIERAITLARDEWIRASDLPENIDHPHNSTEFVSISLDTSLKEAKKALIARFEKEYLTKMLRRHHGNISRAAKESDMDRRTLHRLINRYHIEVGRREE